MGDLLHATVVCCEMQEPRKVRGRERGKKGLLRLYYALIGDIRYAAVGHHQHSALWPRRKSETTKVREVGS